MIYINYSLIILLVVFYIYIDGLFLKQFRKLGKEE